MVSRTSNSLKYSLRFIPKWTRLSLRTYFNSNRNTKRAFRRILSARAARFFKGQRKNPSTLQIMDNLQCQGHCTGCLFRRFSHRQKNLDQKTMEHLLTQAEDLGITTVYLLGADILLREDSQEYLEMLGRHRSMLFLLFTEGHGLNEEAMDKIEGFGNIMVIFSLDGPEEETNQRKGPGSFAEILRGMTGLRQKRVPFGISTMVSNQNYSRVIHDEYTDFLERQGAFFLVYIPYCDPTDSENILSLDEMLFQQIFPWTIKQNRRNRRLIIMDMLGVEENLTGCPAGSEILSVYHDGTVTPCFALPFGDPDSNIKTKSLASIINEDRLCAYIAEQRKKKKLKCLFAHPAPLSNYSNKDQLKRLSEELWDKAKIQE